MARKVIGIPKVANWPLVSEIPDGWEGEVPTAPSQPDYQVVRESRPVIGIIVPTYGHQLHDSISRAINVATQQFQCYISTRSGTYIAKNRNNQIREMLKLDNPPVKYIVAVDADSVLDPESILKVVVRAEALNAPVYAAAYMKKNDGNECFGIDCGAGNWKKNLEKLMPWNWGDIIEVDWVGMGLMCIRREVFDHIKFPYMVDYYRGEEFVGEDIDFCRECRILRIPLLVDTGLPIAHHGSDQVTPNQTIAFGEPEKKSGPRKSVPKGKKQRKKQ